MKTVRCFIVLWEDEEMNHHQEYIQALSATHAVDILGIPHNQVVEVAVVLKNWKGSK